MVLRVTATCNRLNAAQTIKHTKNHIASFTSYHQNAVKTIMLTKLHRFFFCLFMKQETKQTMHIEYGCNGTGLRNMQVATVTDDLYSATA